MFKIKVLSIGNSFSQDAHKWLHDIAETDDFKLDTDNLFIGGCSLDMHWDNVIGNTAAYDMEGNGGKFIKKVSINEALEIEKYDIITLQQVSALSGKPQTYIPYITKLADLVREKQPEAKLYLHRTWSYEIDSNQNGFEEYNKNQKEMYRRLCDASEMAAKIIDAVIIPVGNVIQSLRENEKEFDYENGGLSLCRDGFHLSLDYGRFAAAAVWYKTLTGRNVNMQKFVDLNTEFDINLINTIMKYVDK